MPSRGRDFLALSGVSEPASAESDGLAVYRSTLLEH